MNLAFTLATLGSRLSKLDRRKLLLIRNSFNRQLGLISSFMKLDLIGVAQAHNLLDLARNDRTLIGL